MVSVKVSRTHDGAVATIVLNRPDKRNAISPAMFDAMIAAFEEEPSAEQRVTVIRAEGRAFCAGVDLSERIENGWPRESPLVRLCDAMLGHPLPIVGGVQGDAIAGGCMIALHCDLVVAAEGTQFAMPLAQLGIAPPWILTSRTLNRVGPALARELLLLGDPVVAERLAQHNAINVVAPADRFDDEVERVVQRLILNAPLSLRAVKAALSSTAPADADAAHGDEDELVRLALDSTDAREGMRSRLERRAPRFRGQ